MIAIDRSPWLDAVRGVAILQVLFWHIFQPQLVARAPSYAIFTNMTWSGVDLFFVLSGLLIGSILIRQRQAPNYFLAFYARRAFRILPLYAIVVAIFLVVKGSEPVLPLLTFTQNYTWAYQSRFGDPSIGVTWSLAVEEQFYLILPAMVLLTPSRWLGVVSLGCVAAALVLRIILWMSPGWHFFEAYMWMPARMDGLFVGVFLAWSIQSRHADWLVRNRLALKALAATGSIGLVVASAAGLVVSDPFIWVGGLTCSAIAYGAVVALAATTTRPLPAVLLPVAGCGVLAYGLYLLHIPVFLIVLAVYPWTLGIGLPGFLVSVMVTLFALATAVFLAFENPLTKLGRRLFPYQQRKPSPHHNASDVRELSEA